MVIKESAIGFVHLRDTVESGGFLILSPGAPFIEEALAKGAKG
jgi:hypothetical protein